MAERKYQDAVNAVTLDGFTEKEIDYYIKREERRIERIKSKMQEMRCDLYATYNALDMWRVMKKKIRKRKKQESAK